jgi:hypothetical protein
MRVSWASNAMPRMNQNFLGNASTRAAIVVANEFSKTG